MTLDIRREVQTLIARARSTQSLNQVREVEDRLVVMCGGSPVCAHGHLEFHDGCVSCVLLHSTKD